MKRSLLLLSIIFSSIYSGCTKEDDPVGPPEEHFEAIGVYLTTSGIKLASILRGETTDTLYAPLDSLSDHIEVQFYDEDENIVDPPSDEDQTLAFEIENENVAEVFQQPGEEGGFEFHLQGKAQGETTIELFIMHNNHADFRSGKIPVLVQ